MVKAILNSINSLIGCFLSFVSDFIFCLKSHDIKRFFDYYFFQQPGAKIKQFYFSFLKLLDGEPLNISTEKIAVWIFWILAILFIWHISQKKHEYILPKNLKRSFFPDGILFGRWRWKYVYSPTDTEGHVGVFAGSGAGKTYTIAVPTLKNYDGNAFVLDISGDIASKCADENSLFFDVLNPDSVPYNVFGAVDCAKTREDKIEALELLAKIIIPDAITVDGRKTGEDFYSAGGQEILIIYLIAMYFSGMDFIQICKQFLDSSPADVMEAIDKSGVEEAIHRVNKLVGLDDKWIHGQKDAANSALNLFANKKVLESNIRRPYENEKSITPFEIENHSIYIELHDESLNVYKSLLSLIVGQMLEYLKGREIYKKCPRILLMLDEFTSFRLNVNDVNEAFQKYRKKHVRIMILMQSTANLDGLYGETKRREILSNIDFIVLLGNINDVKSRQYFADYIGTHKVKQVSKSRSFASFTEQTTTSKSESEHSEYVIEPADLDRLGRQQMILINNHIRPNGFMVMKKTKHLKG